jgi:nucleoid-associated protein YgaU
MMWSGEWDDTALRHLLSRGAGFVALATGTLLVLAFAGEVLRTGGRARGVVAVIDRLTPHSFRWMAAALIPAAFFAGSAASAEPATTTTTTSAVPDSIPDGVRAFLSPTTSTTTTTSTTATTTTRVAAPVVVTLPAAPPRASRPAPSRAYVVKPGDCLWTIAKRALPPGASNTAIDRAWRQIYTANRSVIGRDPNLIRPGLALTLPPASTLHAPEEPDA